MVDRKREQWLDNLKGFAILCVVIGHIIEKTQTGLNYNGGISHIVDIFVNRIHIYIFFMVSGYLYGKYTRNNIAGISDMKEFLKKKSWDLLLPYTLFAVLVWVGKFSFSKFVEKKVSLFDLFDMYVNPIAFMWYIYVLFLIMAVIACLDVLLNKNYAIITVIGIVLLIMDVVLAPSIISVDKFMRNFIIFFIGVIISNYKKILDNKIVFACISIIFCLFTVLTFSYSESNLWIVVVENISGSLFFLFLFYKIKKYSSNILTLLGENTLYIYILHPIILSLVRLVLMKGQVTNRMIWYLLMLVLGICTPLLYSYNTKKLWILNILFKPRSCCKKLKMIISHN